MNSDKDLSSAWRKDLDLSNSNAWQRLLQALLPITKSMVREKFGLLARHGGDENATEGSLLLAWTSFQRHFLNGEFDDFRSLDSLAGHFLRIAYNRWKRDHRAQVLVNQAVANGVARDNSGEIVLRDFVDTSLGPDEKAVAKELREYLLKTLDLVLQDISGVCSHVVKAKLQDIENDCMRTQEEIADDLGTSQAKVSRCLDRFWDRVRKLLAANGES